MNYSIILATLIVASLLTFIFSRSFKSRGPLGGLLIFFLIIFMTTLSGQLWISPIGPVIWGVDWALLIFTALLFALLMVALSSPAPAANNLHPTPKGGDVEAALGIFFWILLIALALSIIIGYFRIIRNKPSIEIATTTYIY